MAIIRPPLREHLTVNDQTKTAQWPSVWSNWLGSLHRAIGGWTETLTATKTFDFGSISAQSESTTTVAVTGARVSDAVIVTCSNVSGLSVDGSVTADDVVTIRRMNFSSGAVNPASDTFRVIVFRQ